MHYNWNLKDTIFTKDKGNVFSCFSCGGGSTMGYKLAGFNVLGCNEIDPKMMDIYIENHSPKYSFLESIADFKNRENLPAELFNLEILDGSPPCSSFSMVGTRKKDWGQKRKFREGQKEQILDRLFFDFIDLAKRLKPKVVIAENVKGILAGNAKKYVIEIYKNFDDAGYYCQHFVLDASTMGVPQKRKRVFFICLRKDLATPFLYKKDLFTIIPKLDLFFNSPKIPFKEITTDGTRVKMSPCYKKYWEKCKPGEEVKKYHPRGWYFGTYKINKNKVLNTIKAHDRGGSSGAIMEDIYAGLTKLEILKASSFPQDFKCKNPYYICGMSVPPLMIGRIAEEIHKQWLSKI